MEIHHVNSIVMLVYTYYWQVPSIMILLCFICDISDPFLELAKICVYLKYDLGSSAMFGIFAVVFTTVRLFLHPAIIIYPTLTTLHSYSEKIGSYHFYYVINSCFLLLFGLNIYWEHFIIKLLKHLLFDKSNVKDTRSDDES